MADIYFAAVCCLRFDLDSSTETKNDLTDDDTRRRIWRKYVVFPDLHTSRFSLPRSAASTRFSMTQFSAGPSDQVVPSLGTVRRQHACTVIRRVIWKALQLRISSSDDGIRLQSVQ